MARNSRDDVPHTSLRRRDVVRAAAIAVVAAVLPGFPLGDAATAQERLKIGIIGAGNIGGALGEHWAKAGHEVFLSSRHPETLKPLADRLGPLAQAGTPREAAASINCNACRHASGYLRCWMVATLNGRPQSRAIGDSHSYSRAKPSASSPPPP